MRTTVVIKDEAYELARVRAHLRRQSLGEAISDLILERASQRTQVIGTNSLGLPTFRSQHPTTVESVKRILDEDE
ncbi:MAG: DUF2191 domain-containing protein [Verrucomicrobiaceae bacterium]|nr:MAG: DUF2191 domain-containing protein [Verrucomicrobiaceae bacterium]